MPSLIKNVLIERNDQERSFTILSPAVGIYLKTPELGAYLKGGSPAGLLKILNTLYHLRLPENVNGFVRKIKVNDLANPVEFRQELYTLLPARDRAPSNVNLDESMGPEERTTIREEGRPVGTYSIVSPTEGIFYLRPNPTAPPYVREGDVVSSGAILGLVEVMKSFNQICFTGPDFPEKARVLKILVPDGAEIRSGQTLIWLKPY